MPVRALSRDIVLGTKPNDRQLMDYGAAPELVAVRFTIGRRGRPPEGREARVFAMDEVGRQSLAIFLASGEWRKVPHVFIQTTARIHKGHVEMVNEKTMIIIESGDVSVFSATPQPLSEDV